MKKHYLMFNTLAILAFALLLAGGRAYADDAPGFNAQLNAAQTHRTQVEVKLGIKARERVYDLADHYNQDHLMRAVDIDVDIC